MHAVKISPLVAFELLFFAVFGQTTTDELQKNPNDQPPWVLIIFKIFFGIYMLLSVVVLINLLIAMMSDTYQRIQVLLRPRGADGAGRGVARLQIQKARGPWSAQPPLKCGRRARFAERRRCLDPVRSAWPFLYSFPIIPCLFFQSG